QGAQQDRRATRRVQQALDGRQRGWHHQAGQAQQPARETPMSEYQEFTGRTVEEAIRAAREALGVADLADLDFEMLTPGTRGVRGWGAEPARIIAAARSALGGQTPKKEAAAAEPLPPPPPRPPRDDRRDRDRGPRDRGPRDHGHEHRTEAPRTEAP